jgi:Putative prokaryotic signal transducing protein
MIELLRTNDIVLMSYVRALLSAENIRCIELDQHMSMVEGSIPAIQQRIMVDDNDSERARRLLDDAGLGHVLKR